MKRLAKELGGATENCQVVFISNSILRRLTLKKNSTLLILEKTQLEKGVNVVTCQVQEW